ncbi:MAG: transglutaminase domain-containing protein, partial [Pseudomonadales bacterium]
MQVIRKAYEEVNASIDTLAPDRFDSTAVLDQAKYEGEAIVDWISNNTRWVPYQGVLRGAPGVLLDRQGNSLDRSLLLAELLDAAGYESRLVHGQLSASAIAAVLSMKHADALDPNFAPERFSSPVREAVKEASLQASALARLAKLPDTAEAKTIADMIADHWWVEAKFQNDWRALDPLLVGDFASLRPAPAAYLQPQDLPGSLFHQVMIRVVIERWQEGEVTEAIPLEHKVRVADAIYHDFELQFGPYHFEVIAADQGALAQAVSLAQTTEEWLPVLRLRGDSVQQQGFNRHGDLVRNPGRVAVARKLESATRALGTMGANKDEEPRSVLSACWIEYQLQVPSRNPEVVRRELFDLIGPARRAGGELKRLDVDLATAGERGRLLMGLHRILITGIDLPPVAAERAALELWGVNGPQLAAYVRLMVDPDATDLLLNLYREPLVGVDLLELAATRRALAPHRTATFLATPNILSTHYLLTLEDDLATRIGIDLVANEVGVVPNSSIPAGRIRLQQGVLDTALEAALSDSDAGSNNTSALFAHRGGETGEWRVIDADGPAPALPAMALARMRHAIQAGRLVVAPEKLAPGQQPAWWEVDPNSGTTLGIGSRGWGQAVEGLATRSIGTGGVSKGTERIGWKVTCKMLGAFLRTQGLMLRNASGGWAYT